MWGKKDNHDYMNKVYFDDGLRNRTPIQNRLRNNNNSLKGLIPIILIVIIGSVVYNVARKCDGDNSPSTLTSQKQVSKQYKEVDEYLTKFDEFSKDGYNFINEVITIYSEGDYSTERITKLESWSDKLQDYDFSSYSSSKYDKGNNNVATLKSYIKDSTSLIKNSKPIDSNISSALEELVTSYDNIDSEYMDIIIDLLKFSGIKYEKTEDGGVDYWPY